MKIIQCALLCMFSGSALAGDWKLNINLASVHFNDEPSGIEKYNEINLGAGVEYLTDSNVIYFSGGFFKNSFQETSRYLGIGINLYQAPNRDLGFELAFASGYEKMDFDNRVYGDETQSSVPRAFPGIFFKPKMSERGALKINYAKQLISFQYQYDM